MTSRLLVCAALASVLALAAPLGAAPPEEEAPSAVQVVLRGKTDLSEALVAAARPAFTDGASRPVLLVLDVTPNTQAATDRFGTALASLEDVAHAVPAWHVAALGAKPSRAVERATGLTPLLPRTVDQVTDVPSTLTALDKTLDAWRTENGVVVYVADWHFEDDVDLEKFIGDLQRKGRTLSVLGTEAACGRGWNDGFREMTEHFEESIRGSEFKDYWEGIGRDPFGRSNRKAPWHGGDTAYPYAPYRWDRQLWRTTFTQSDWDSADLDEDVSDNPVDSLADTLRRLAEAHVEVATLEQDLARLDPDSAEAKALEKRIALLRRVIAEIQREPGLPQSTEEETDVTPLEALEAERARVSDEAFQALEKSLEAREPAEAQRWKAEHERLQAEVERLAAEIRAIRAADTAEAAELDAEELEEPEDLRRRLPGRTDAPEEEPRPYVDPDLDRFVLFPLPSSFGPYGLMRACGVTGGRYVLFSWNPAGRKNVVLEYARCNLFPPDLRSRKEIRAGLSSNPWARGLLLAWWEIIRLRAEVLEHTPPLRENLRSAARMERPDVLEYLTRIWERPSDQKRYVKHTRRAIESLEQAIQHMDKALAEAGEAQTPVDRRYEAEALLFRHAARVVRFQLAESLHAAAMIDRAAWRDRKEHGVIGVTWVACGRNPDAVRARQGPRVFDAERGQDLLEERARLLARFRGTPFGEQLAMNEVQSSRPLVWTKTSSGGPDTGRSPTESVDRPKPTPRAPGSGSGSAGGPTSGG